jgi:TatD DNase family protein
LTGIIDTHCHLDFDTFNTDRELVISRASKVGVEKLVNPGIDINSSQNAIRLAEKYKNIYVAVGLHPNSSLSDADSLVEIKTLASHPKTVAIGEIGLDYYRDYNPYNLQIEVFKKQLNLAAELNLPVIIHNRMADSEVAEILLEWHNSLVKANLPLANRPGVLHSFSSSYEFARTMLDRNFFLGISGPITFQNAQDLRAVITKIGLENLLIETDAPFLSPQPHRGHRNEPAYLAYVARKLAEIYDTDFETVAFTTSRNAKRIFNWRE